MNDSFDNIGELIALKRFEQPRDGFQEEFLAEFHRRQREDLLKRSSRSLFWERVVAWFSDRVGVQWAYGAGLAYAAVTAGLFLWPHEPSAPVPSAVPVSYEVPAAAPAPGEMEELDLRPAGEAELSEKVF